MEAYTGEWPIYKSITVLTPEHLLTAERQDSCFCVKPELTHHAQHRHWVSSPLSRCGLHS